VRTDPWDPAATVVVHFDASGSYTGHCLATCQGGVWHYGTDDDLPSKTYQVYNLLPDQTGQAHIVITYSATEALDGTLDAIAIDSTATTLSFDFYPTWLGMLGPVHFDLMRTQ
jgi:hypothetical protein